MAEYLFPDASFAIGQLDPENAQPEELRPYNGYSLQFSSTERLYYANSNVGESLFPTPSDRAAYGSLPFTPLKSLHQLRSQRVLVIDDETGDSGGVIPDQEFAKSLVADCWGKMSFEIAETVTNKDNVPIQFRLGIRPQLGNDAYRIAKGTLAPDPRLSNLGGTIQVTASGDATKELNLGEYDLILATSMFKGRKGADAIAPGSHVLDLGLGLKAERIKMTETSTKLARIRWLLSSYYPIGSFSTWSKKRSAIARLIADLATPVIEGEIKRQRRIVIPTYSQTQAEALERFIGERFPHLLTVRIDSTTTETDAGREFVERPNEKILQLQPDVLIYTSSMGAGVSIDVPWFDQMYAFFNGVVEPSQCRQMLGRVRATIPRTIWCRKRGQIEGNASFLPAEIKSHLFVFHRDTSILIDVMQAIAGDDPSDYQLRQAYDAIWNPTKQEWDNSHLDLYCNLVARKNYGLAHLASELRRQLIAEGHAVIEGEGDVSNEEGSRVAQIKRQLPLEVAQAIALGS